MLRRAIQRQLVRWMLFHQLDHDVTDVSAGETSTGQAGSGEGDTLLGTSPSTVGETLGKCSRRAGGDEEVWTADESEVLDSGEGGGVLGGLFENLDLFGDS